MRFSVRSFSAAQSRVLFSLEVEHYHPHPVGERAGRTSLGREGLYATLPGSVLNLEMAVELWQSD